MSVFELLDQGSSQQQWRFGASQLFFQQDSNKARTGVLPSGSGANLSVAQTTSASGSVTVQAGTCVIADASVSQGAHVLSSDSTMTVDVLGPNPATSLPRIDLVVMDGAAGSIRTVTGSPASVPTAPTLPASSVALALLSIGANASTIPSSSITDARVYTALRGATLWLNNLTERAAVEASCQAGQPVWVISEQRLYTKQSTGWDDVFTAGLGDVGAGWSVASLSFTRRGGAVYISMQATRTGTALTANSNGNLSDETVMTITMAGFAPAINSAGTWSALNGGVLGAHGSVVVNSAGAILLTDCTPSGVIGTGVVVGISVAYPAA